ncbi:MAG: glycosyltransferase family 39 protein [Planctomycetota bacterium]|nr:glycosyltransferase family 39 protein [Planctomycetota bacterium]
MEPRRAGEAARTQQFLTGRRRAFDPHDLAPAGHPDEPPGAARWPRSRRWAASFGLACVYVILTCHQLHVMPLLDPDEPRYAATGRTMAEGGSWLIPEFNGEPRVNKPPLYYWLVALSNLAFGGSNEVTSRLPSVFMGALMLVLTVWAGRRLYGDATAWLAGLILATAPLFFAMSRACIIDETFSTLLAAGLGCLLLGLTGRWPLPGRTSVLAAAAFGGLAFMAKGTATLILLLTPLVFILCFRLGAFIRQPGGTFWVKTWLTVTALGLAWGLVWPRQEPAFLTGAFPEIVVAGPVMAVLAVIYYGMPAYWKPNRWPLALALLLALSLWWYLYLWNHLGTERFFEMVKHETAGRFEGRMHAESPLYFLYIFLGVFFPWSLGLVAALGAASRQAPEPLPLDPAAAPEPVRRRVSDAFLAAWVFTVVLFFSVPAAKLTTYILPAFPAAALLTARLLLRIRDEVEPVSRFWKGTVLGVVLLVAELLILLGCGPHEQPRGRQQPSPFLLVALAALCVSAGLAAHFLLRAKATSGAQRRRATLYGLAVLVCTPLAAAAILIPTRVLQLPNRWANVLEVSPVPLWGISATAMACCCVPWALACLTSWIRWTSMALGAFVVILIVTMLPTVAMPGLMRRSDKYVVEDVSPWLGEDRTYYTVGCEEESLVYYLRAVVKEAPKTDEKGEATRLDMLKRLIPSKPPGQILFFVHRRFFDFGMKSLPPEGTRVLLHSHHIVVLINEPEAR